MTVAIFEKWNALDLHTEMFRQDAKRFHPAPLRSGFRSVADFTSSHYTGIGQA